MSFSNENRSARPAIFHPAADWRLTGFTRPLPAGRRLIVHGTGRLAQAFLDRYPDPPIDYFIDSNPARREASFGGRPVRPPEALKTETRGTFLVVAALAARREAAAQLSALGLDYGADFVFYEGGDLEPTWAQLREELSSLSRRYAGASDLGEKARLREECRALTGGRERPAPEDSPPSPGDWDMLLITPPYWDIHSPFSAVPCLAAALKKRGFRGRNLDLNVAAFYRLTDDFRRVREEFTSERHFEDQIRPRDDVALKSHAEYLERLAPLLGQAVTLDDVRRMYGRLDTFQRSILDGIFSALIDRRVHAPELSEGFELAEGVRRNDVGPILEALAHCGLVGQFLNLPPVVGLSITSLGQVYPALFLAQLARAFRPDVQILAGGSAVEIIRQASEPLLCQLFDHFDYLCSGEGETCLPLLLERLRDGREDLADVPNLVWPRDGRLIRNEEILEDVTGLEPPDYDGVDWSLYLTPVLSYQASRGCFYGHCAFCNHCERYRRNYRKKKPEQVAEDLRHLTARYGVEYVQFVDEAIEPHFLAEILDALEKNPPSRSFRWFYYSRVSPVYTPELVDRLRRAGCEMVMLGVETFNQRLLKHIRKGISAEEAVRNLRLFTEAGIKTYAWFMTILPSQTLEEMVADCRAIEEHREVISAAALGSFRLVPATDMYREPEKYHILRLVPPEGFVSHDVDGRELDSAPLAGYFHREFQPMMTRRFPIGNRYVVFFDGLAGPPEHSPAPGEKS